MKRFILMGIAILCMSSMSMAADVILDGNENDLPFDWRRLPMKPYLAESMPI